MHEPEALDQLRQSLRSFRSEVAKRQRLEAEAGARLNTAIQHADETRNLAQREADTVRAKAEADANNRYKTDREAADAALANARNVADDGLKRSEAEIKSRFEAESQAADADLFHAKEAADLELERAKATIATSFKTACEREETARQQILAQAEVELKTAYESLESPRWDLYSSGLSYLLGPSPSSVSDGLMRPESVSPILALTESSQVAVSAAGHAIDAVRSLETWQAAWTRRRNWIVLGSIALLVVLAIVILASVSQSFASTVAATATAQAPVTSTARAIVASTQQARGTATGIAQETATAAASTSQAKAALAAATATVQERETRIAVIAATLIAEVQSSATAQAAATATERARPTATPTPTPLPDAVTNSATVNLRGGPGADFPTLGNYPRGIALSVSGKDFGGEWLKVRMSDGKEGWMSAALLQVNVSVSRLSVAGTLPSPVSATGPFFGPADGLLNHREDRFMAARRVGLTLNNFVAIARFFNPYDVSRGGWSNGFIFRVSDRFAYYLWVSASGSWRCSLRRQGPADSEPTWTECGAGNVVAWNSSSGDSNELRIEVRGRTAIFFVNGNYIEMVDVSANLDAGDIWVGEGFTSGSQIGGESTKYQNLKVWALP